MRLIDADALIDDLEHDVAIDEDILNYVGTVGAERINTQFDKDCKQNAIDLLLRTPTIEPTVDKDYLVSLIQEAVYDGEACKRLLDLVEPKQGEWIPCSERLPEDIRPVLVTWKNNDPASYYQYIVGKHFIGTAHYHRGKWFWYSSVTEDLLAEYGKCDGEEFDEAIEVVAWQPLPEPMKGADDD